MITTDDPSGNGFTAFGLFDLASSMDLSPRTHADRTFIMIAGRTKYKTFYRARNYAWLHHTEPLYIQFYKDAVSGCWHYHRIGCWWQTNRHRDLPGAVELNLEEVTAIINGGRSYLDRLLKGEAII